MNVSAVLPKKNRRMPLRIAKARRGLLLPCLLMIAGSGCGVLLFFLFRTAFQSALWETYVAFRTDTGSRTILEVFSGFALQNLLLWGALSLFGTTPFGALGAHGLTVVKCMGSGALTAFFLCSFGTGGVGYYFLAVFPGKLLLLFTLLLLYSASVRQSRTVRTALKGEGALLPDSWHRYCVTLAVTGCLLLLSALVDCLTVTFFSGVFQLSLH